MLTVSHKFHYAFYFFMYYDLTHWFVGFWVICVIEFSIWSYPQKWRNGKEIIHTLLWEISNLRFWLISIFKSSQSWLQNSENKCIGAARKDYCSHCELWFFFSGYRRKSLKENVGQVLLFPATFRRVITKSQWLALISNDGDRREIGEKV